MNFYKISMLLFCITVGVAIIGTTGLFITPGSDFSIEKYGWGMIGWAVGCFAAGTVLGYFTGGTSLTTGAMGAVTGLYVKLMWDAQSYFKSIALLIDGGNPHGTAGFILLIMFLIFTFIGVVFLIQFVVGSVKEHQ